MSKSRGDSPDWAKWTPGAEELEQVVARFNDPADPLKIIIVTAKLLTGFDAPILHCQYLDKPLKEHTLLQAITRTNRVYPPNKTHGLIVDYLGIFDDVAKSLAFDEKSVQQVISNIEELKKQLAPAMAAALAFFPGVDRTVGGYEGLDPGAVGDRRRRGQGCLRSRPTASSRSCGRPSAPTRCSRQYRDDYRWLTDVYESVRPVRHRRPAGVARARREDDRPDQRARPGRDPARRRDDRPRCADHRGPDDRASARTSRPRRSRSRSPPGSPATSTTRSSSNSASASTRCGRSTPTSSSPASTSCANCWNWPATPSRRRRPPPRSLARSRARRRSPSSSRRSRARRPRSSSRTSSTESTRSSERSASRAGSRPSAATRRSGRRCARRSTSSSRSATTTSSRRPSATSGSTTELMKTHGPSSPSVRLHDMPAAPCVTGG